MDAPANKPRHRPSRFRTAIRKITKWGGLILSILVIAAWAASAWLTTWYWSKVGIGTGVREGLLELGWDSGLVSGVVLGNGGLLTHPPTLRWSFHILNSGTAWGVAIPFWGIALPTIALTISAWLRDAAHRRRFLLTHCSTCGYDCTGIAATATVCPECGAATPMLARP